MNDDLNKLNLGNRCIDIIKNTFDYDTLASIAINHEIINDNIKLLISYGIKNIDDLFIEKYYIFIFQTEELVKKFSKYNIPAFVQIINNDFSAIDKILS